VKGGEELKHVSREVDSEKWGRIRWGEGEKTETRGVCGRRRGQRKDKKRDKKREKRAGTQKGKREMKERERTPSREWHCW
jgi:hypothetical protein